MADPTPTAQVTAREIPITIQGSQIVEGTDRRELFTETLKTKLIFDNGAAIELKARVAPGQSLFLRNELSGREILCRVIEVPPPGQTGCTDLEFTIHDPDFWTTVSEPPAGTEEAPAPQESTAAPATTETAAAAPKVESGAEPSAPIETPPVPAVAAGAETPSAPALSSAHAELQPPSQPAPVPEVDDAKEAEQLAGILQKYAKAIAKRASAKSAEQEAAQQQAAANAAAQGDAPPGVTPKAKAFSTLAFRLHGLRELTVRKNPIALGIVACIVIGSALGVSWDVTRMLYPESTWSLASIARRKAPAPHAKAAPAKSAVAKANKSEVAPAQPKPKTQTPTVAQVPAAHIAKTPAATPVDAASARRAKDVENSAAPVVWRMEAGPGALTSSQASPGDSRPRRGEATPEMIPVRILSQYEPPLPKWAKDLDLEGTVTLDAVIDEKGNLKQTKLVSGPRVLESSAESAVGLWIFQPALKGGKPTTAHMVLTVEFQR
jgi:periplasmic protein TonB